MVRPRSIAAFVFSSWLRRGWYIGDLELLVDDEGLLIRFAHRSRNIFADSPERMLDGCLDLAGVSRPPTICSAAADRTCAMLAIVAP